MIKSVTSTSIRNSTLSG